MRARGNLYPEKVSATKQAQINLSMLQAQIDMAQDPMQRAVLISQLQLELQKSLALANQLRSFDASWQALP